MTVNLTMSDASGGNPLADVNDMGTVTTGADTSEQDIYISHDAVVNPITDCAMYATRYAGSGYLGVDADADFTAIMGWGDAGTGGIKLSMNSTWYTFKNGLGDVDNQVTLDKNTLVVGSTSNDGEIPVGGEAYIKVKVAVPGIGVVAGYKAFSFVFAYSSTS